MFLGKKDFHNCNIDSNKYTNNNNNLIIENENSKSTTLDINLIKRVLSNSYLKRYIFRQVRLISRLKYGLLRSEHRTIEPSPLLASLRSSHDQEKSSSSQLVLYYIDSIKYYNDLWNAEWIIRNGYSQLLEYRIRKNHNVQINHASVLLAVQLKYIDANTLRLVLEERREYQDPELYQLAAQKGFIDKMKVIEDLMHPISKQIIVMAMNTAIEMNQLEVLRYLVEKYRLGREHLTHFNRRSFYKSMNADLIRYCIDTLMNNQWNLELNCDLHLFYLCGDLELIKSMCNRNDAGARHIMLIALEHYINDLLILPELAPEFDHPKKDHIGVVKYIHQMIGFPPLSNKDNVLEIVEEHFQLKSREHQLLAIFYITLLQMDLHIYAQGVLSYNTIRKLVSINNIPLMKYIIEMPLSRSNLKNNYNNNNSNNNNNVNNQHTNVNSILPIMFGAAVEIGTLEQVQFLIPYHPWQYGLQVIGFGSAEIMKLVREVVPSCQWHDLALERAVISVDLELISMLMRVDKNRGYFIAFSNAIGKGDQCLESIRLLASMNPEKAELSIIQVLQKKGAIITILDNFELFEQYINKVSAKSIMEMASHLGYGSVLQSLHNRFPTVQINIWSSVNGRQITLLEYIMENGFGNETKSSWLAVAEKGFVELFDVMIHYLKVPSAPLVREMCMVAASQGKVEILDRLHDIEGFDIDPLVAINNGHLNVLSAYISNWLKSPLSNKQLNKMKKVAGNSKQKLILEYLNSLSVSSTRKKSITTSKLLDCKHIKLLKNKLS